MEFARPEDGAVGPVPAEGKPWVAERQESRRVFTTSLGSAASGRLEFVSRAWQVAIRAEASSGDLYRAHFAHPEPTVRVRGGTVVIDVGEVPLSELDLGWQEEHASIALSGRVPWRIDFRGGASQLTADLRGLRLTALEVNDGASRTVLTLPPPSGRVPVRILGGATSVAIHRPQGVRARVRVRGGVTTMVFDEQRVGVAAGELMLESPGGEQTAGCYDIEVSGGANQLTLDTSHGAQAG